MTSSFERERLLAVEAFEKELNNIAGDSEHEINLDNFYNNYGEFYIMTNNHTGYHGRLDYSEGRALVSELTVKRGETEETLVNRDDGLDIRFDRDRDKIYSMIV